MMVFRKGFKLNSSKMPPQAPDITLLMDGKLQCLSKEAVATIEDAVEAFGLKGKEDALTLALTFLKYAADARKNGEDITVGAGKVIDLKEVRQVPEGVYIPVPQQKTSPEKRSGRIYKI